MGPVRSAEAAVRFRGDRAVLQELHAGALQDRPFGEGPQTGVCGANADVMVARWVARAVAAGTASHGGHAKHLAHTLLKSANGQASDYPIKDEAKLRAVAARIGVTGGDVKTLARNVALKALEEFTEKESRSPGPRPR